MWKLKAFTKICSQRVALAFIGFLGFVNLYALRVNMSVAMVCMVNQTTQDQVNGGAFNYSRNLQPECERGDINNTDTKTQDGELNWSKPTQGFILSSFFWGYVVTQIPGGWLAARFGGKRVFGWCMFCCACATMLIPMAARTHVICLMVLRIFTGLMQGVSWPAMHALWTYWAPPLERSMLIGFTFSGTQLGTAITFLTSGFLCEYGFAGGWPSIFYVQGVLGILWFVAWMYIVYDTPQQHPRISDMEKEYIQSSLTGQTSKTIKKAAVPWCLMLKSPAVWGLILAETCGNWIFYTFLTNMPSYLHEVHKLSIGKNGFLSAIPYIGMWSMCFSSGFLADYLRTRHILTTTSVRKINFTVGISIPAVLCIVLGYIECTNLVLAVSLIIISVSLLGLTVSTLGCNAADIAPKFASLLYSIQNTVGSIPGFLAPSVIGIVTKDSTQAQWRIVFFIATAIAMFGSLFYLITGSGEVRGWAHDREEENDMENTPMVDVKANEQYNKLMNKSDTFTSCYQDPVHY